MSDRPTPAVPETAVVRDRGEDHTVLEYDFSDWDDQKRDGLRLLLRLDEVPALWEDVGMLVVGRTWKDRVDVAVEQVEAGTPERADREAAPDRQPSNVPVMAGPGRRLLGWLVDWLILVTLVRLAAKVDSVFTNSFTIFAVFALYQVVATAFWGRTIGKLVVRTRVDRLDGVSPPGLRVAAIRWAVPAAALLFVFLGLVEVRPTFPVATAKWCEGQTAGGCSFPTSALACGLRRVSATSSNGRLRGVRCGREGLVSDRGSAPR